MKPLTKTKLIIYTLIIIATALMTTYLKFINSHIDSYILFPISLILTGGLYGLLAMLIYGVHKFDKLNEEMD